ncbi:hypothetical protein AAFF_G00331020 [Aldrovandia affinis]|uniref:Uncharacterized protein n=1 Tax=Aldrovandia affinis TaxID=143900 RepID=A0AAD7R6E8_9TELE|nr:hypothetical protein AAFF_G00331020 [Aldrovandia affinis]
MQVLSVAPPGLTVVSAWLHPGLTCVSIWSPQSLTGVLVRYLLKGSPQVSAKYHTYNISPISHAGLTHISCRSHPYLMQVSPISHAGLTHISCRSHPYLMQVSPISHVGLSHISCSSCPYLTQVSSRSWISHTSVQYLHYKMYRKGIESRKHNGDMESQSTVSLLVHISLLWKSGAVETVTKCIFIYSSVVWSEAQHETSFVRVSRLLGSKEPASPL